MELSRPTPLVGGTGGDLAMAEGESKEKREIIVTDYIVLHEEVFGG